MTIKTLICDIETDGLDATRVWVIVGYDVDTEEYFILDNPDTMKQEAEELFAKYDRIVGHNFIQFDAPVLDKVLGIQIPHEKLWDTLVVSRMRYIAAAGGREHSLAAWGERLGYPKVEHEDWSKYSKEMLHRCKVDVELNYKVYVKLLKETRGFSKLSLDVEFYMAKMLKDQRDHGFPIDTEAMKKRYREIEEEARTLEDQVLEEFIPVLKPIVVKQMVTVRKPKVNKDGTLSKVGLKSFYSEEEIDSGMVSGLFCPLKLVEFNIRSTPQVRERLDKVGWRPVEFTDKGNAKLSRANLETLPSDAPECFFKLQKLFNLKSQMSTLDTWYNAMDSQGRIHGSVTSPGTWTHRCTHDKPNTANIAQNLRTLWVPPKGSVLMGSDAAGIQLRVLAHLMGDEEYIRQILEGDIHTFNMEMAGFDKRSQAKTFIYAWVLGAGYEKIGAIAEINTVEQARQLIKDNKAVAKKMLTKAKRTKQWKDSKDLYCPEIDAVLIGRMVKGYLLEKSFLTNLPELVKLQERMKEIGERGYMDCWDGRKIFIPPYKKRETLAAHLQGFEASLMKLARGIWTKKCKALGLADVQCLSDVHDEWQTTVPRKLVTQHEIIEFESEDAAEDWERERGGRIWSMPRKLSTESYDKETGAGKYAVYYSQVGEIQVRAIRKAGQILGTKCPMDGDYVIGLNWAETH